MFTPCGKHREDHQRAGKHKRARDLLARTESRGREAAKHILRTLENLPPHMFHSAQTDSKLGSFTQLTEEGTGR